MSWIRSLLCSLGLRNALEARAERLYARQASLQLLELYRQQLRERPDSAPRALYERTLAQRLGPQAARAPELIRHAEESFTQWPVERALSFRHVVHYLIFDEYMHLGKTREGTKTNIGVVVARIVPEDM